MKTASVILDIPTQALDAPYTYLVPDDLQNQTADEYELQVGCEVLVPFGRRKAVGFVVATESDGDIGDAGDSTTGDVTESDSEADNASADSNEDISSKLKPIDRVLSKPFFDEEGAACAQYLAERYVAPLSACIRLFTPPGGVARMVRSRTCAWHLEQPNVGEVDDRWVTLGPQADEFQPRKNAVKQAAIIDTVRHGDIRMVELALEFGSVSQAIKTLAEKDVIRVERRRRMRGTSTSSNEANFPGLDSPRVELTEDQKQALCAIADARTSSRGEVVLIDGVTGSGKTEVYLQAIEQVLADGQNAIMLVPEIALTPQTVARFRGRFGDAVAVMHSRMSQGERYDQWDFIATGQARVVVGARSALFTPLKNVGIIVIDEEHESSYKQDSAPRYHAREVAIWMMRRAHGVVVLGSATPSIESLYAATTDDLWTKVSLPRRVNGRPLPDIEIIDMAAEFRSGARSMFSKHLSRVLQEELASEHKAVLLLNQRGFAKFLLCRDCGFVPVCPSCSTSLTYHDYGSKLVCHYCGHTQAVPSVCPVCSSPYLKKFGAGTQRVEAELRALLDEMFGDTLQVPIIRMDADTTRGKGAHQRLLEQFASSTCAVLLGTQMIAKGLDFNDVTLVGVINADTQLHLPDYRAAERTFDLIDQVAGRAGRGDLAGRVLVQTYEAENTAIRAAATYDRALFLHDELPKRRTLVYPPYARMANVLIWGKSQAAVKKAAEQLHKNICRLVRDCGKRNWCVLAAGSCVLEKLRNTYRWHIVVKCPPDDDISSLFVRLVRARKADPQVHIAVDIDPIDLL